MRIRDLSRRTYLALVAGVSGLGVAASEEAAATVDLRSISYGQTREGELDTGDPEGYRGYYEPVVFSGEEGDVIDVEITTDADPYLMLRDPSGDIVVRDDDGGPGLDSHIDDYRLESSGEYTIIVTSYLSDATFPYVLSLERSDGGGSGADLRSISYGQTRDGEIDTGDPQGHRGYYEPVAFDGSAGDVVDVEMTTSDDPYLMLQDPSGEIVARDDDGGSGLNSHIEGHHLDTSGEYTIVATSYSSGDTFEYTLSLERTGRGGDGADLRSIAYGQTRDGEIDTGDPEGYRGYYEPVSFSGEDGDVISVEITTDADPYLMLRDPDGDIVVRDDDGGPGLDSHIENYRLQSSGEYTIVVTSYLSDATFPYTLSLEGDTSGGGGGTDLRSIAYGQTRDGEIDRDDPQGRRGYYEPVVFSGEEGDVIDVEITTDADPYLMLQDPHGSVVVEDDDGGPGLDSHIEDYRLESSGQYLIVVTSYSSGATFPYTLSLERTGRSGGGADLRSIAYGQTRDGEIDTGDPRGYRGYYEPVTFAGEEGDVVDVEMTTSDDPYLMLQDPSGEIVARDDDGGSGLNSHIADHELASSGEYTIIATSYSSGDTFEYTLSLERTGRGGGGGADLRSISYGETRDGEIDRDDPRGYRGYYEPVAFDGSAGDVVTVEITTDADPYLMLQDPSGEIVTEDDDGGPGLDSEIDGYELQSSGEYTIVVTSYLSDATFPYTLSLEGDTSGGGGSGDLRSIAYGETRDGEIDRDDPQGYRGYYEPVAFDGSAGDVVTIEIDTGDDPYLMLQDPSGEIVTENDDGGTGLDSRIDGYELQSTGEYTIIVTSYSSRDTFPYTLTLERESTGGPGEPDSDYFQVLITDTHGNTIRNADVRIFHVEEHATRSDAEFVELISRATTGRDGYATFDGSLGEAIPLSTLEQLRSEYDGYVSVVAQSPRSYDPGSRPWFDGISQRPADILTRDATGWEVRLHNQLLFGPEDGGRDLGVASIWRSTSPTDPSRQVLCVGISQAGMEFRGADRPFIDSGVASVQVPEDVDVDYTFKRIEWPGTNNNGLAGSLTVHEDYPGLPVYPVMERVAYEELDEGEREDNEAMREAVEGIIGQVPIVGTITGFFQTMADVLDVGEAIVHRIGSGSENRPNETDVVSGTWNSMTFNAVLEVPVEFPDDEEREFAGRALWSAPGTIDNVELDQPFSAGRDVL